MTFIIDQAGLPPGAPGRARTDGKADGSLVTLTNTGTGPVTTFRLVWTPPLDVGAVASLAPTVDPKVWTFAPTPGHYGTYLVELAETEERRAFVVRTPNLGLVIPAFRERAEDNNALDDPAGPDAAGWWRAMQRLITQVDALAGPPTAAELVRVTWYHRNAGGARVVTLYPTLAAAFAAPYPSTFASTAVHDVEPTTGPDDPGPYTLDDVVHYLIRSVAGRDAARLPSLVVPAGGRLTVEGCALIFPTHGVGAAGTGQVTLFDCLVADEITNVASLVARECDIAAIIILGTTSTGGVFERCAFGPGVTLASNAATGGRLAFIDCTFDPTGAPEIIFTGAPGTVRMDARSKFQWDAAGGAVIGGAITVEA